MTNWLNSYKVYSLSVICTHVLIFTFFFPYFMLHILALIFMSTFLWFWCKLQYEIETMARMDLLHMIKETNNNHTKDLLRQELYTLNKRSLWGDEINEAANYGF